MTYDSAARVQQVTTTNNGAYTRYVYGPNYVQSFSTVNTIADEAYSIQVFDGAGRVFATAYNHPGSVGGYRFLNTIFDRMGRAILQSNPTELNSSWLPAGDDAIGVHYSVQTYDWKGRPLVTTHPDGTEKYASYGGCGCAGGEVVTLTDEVGRQQKVYSDVLGRQWKTEMLNDDDSVYSTIANSYNARDQVTLARQYQGADNSGVYQEMTMTYDGYGRLQSKHVPEQDAGTATVYSYNTDDTINSVTDARGASATYSYNARHLVTDISYSAPAGITPTSNITFAYDAMGNRTSMTDGLGSQSYNYNQLSRMTSETRTFNGVGTYTLTYDYNLVGELTKITDPANSTINYGFDPVGRLNGVTGSDTLYGGVSNYASGFAYRGSGAIKGLTYGNNMTLAVQYNSRLQPTQFEIGGRNPQYGSPTAAKTLFSYHADGAVKYSEDTINESRDRAFAYDHVAMLKEAYSGSEARDFVNNTNNGTATGPYRQSYQHDAFGEMTRRDNRFWSANDTFIANYTNRRRTDSGFQYDADGNLTHDTDLAYSYDAVGRNISLTKPNGAIAYAATFDGDGLLVKRVQTQSGTTTMLSYYVRSSVLGGRVITELGGLGQSLGQKQRGYVFAGGQLLAEQESNTVRWQHQNPISGSQGYSTSPGIYFSKAEFDPAGVDVGFEDPYQNLSLPEPPPEGTTGLLVGSGIPNGRCTLNSIPIDCGWATEIQAMEAAQQVVPVNYYATAKIGGKTVFSGYIGSGYASAGSMLMSQERNSGTFTPAGQAYNQQSFWAGVMSGRVTLGYAPDTGISDEGTHDVGTPYHVNVFGGAEYFLPQNPATSIMAPIGGLDKMNALLEQTLKYSDCREALQKLLTQIGVEAKFAPSHTDILDLFNALRNQTGGGGIFVDVTSAQLDLILQGHERGQREVGGGGESSFFYTDRGNWRTRQRWSAVYLKGGYSDRPAPAALPYLYVLTLIHEITHNAPNDSSWDGRTYGHAQMDAAAKKLGTPRGGFDQYVREHCIPKQYW